MNITSLASPLLLVAIFFFGLSLARLIKLFKNELTPFHIVFGLFILECITVYFPIVQTEGERPRALGLDTEIFMVLVSMSLFVAQFAFKPGSRFVADNYQISSIVPYWLIAPIMLGTVAIISFINYKRLGMFPISALKPGEDYLGGGDAFLPFFTPLSWGIGRCLTILAAFRIGLNNLPWRRFISRNSVLLGCALVAVVINTLDGMRNNAILPAIIVFFGCSRRFHFSLKKSFIALGLCGVFFIAAGAARVGDHDWKQTLTVSSNNRAIDTVAAWVLSYAEPSIENLASLIHADPPLNYGTITLSEILPGPVRSLFMDDPDRTASYMSEKNLYVHPGLTFRTIYADFYTDFGYAGSLIVCGLLFWYSANIATKAGLTPRLFMIYLIIIPGIVYFPLMSFYLTITNLLPFGLLLIHTQRPRMMRARVLERAHLQVALNASN
jgi:oligosaccharide repeat unit polymerase